MPAGSVDRATLTAEAQELAAKAQDEFNLAEDQLERLIENGDSLLLAHYNMMTVKWWRKDYRAAVEQGQAYLDRVADLQAAKRRELQNTMVVSYEQQLRADMQRLIDNELRMRAFLANMHYKRGHHELVVQQLDEVLAKAPRLYHEFYNRGRSLLALGRTAEAKQDLERFLSTTDLPLESPQVREAAAAVAKLQ